MPLPALAVPLLWTVGGLATAGTLVKLSGDIRKTQEEETERIRIEDRRQERIINVNPDQIAASTSTPWDDVLLLLRRIAIPLVLIAGGIYLVSTSRRKR